MADTVKARGKKVTNKQKEDLVHHLEQNLAVYKGKFSSEISDEDIQKLWEDVASKLNASGGGAVKNSDEWKRCWSDLKSRVKAKNQLNKIERNKTGGGEANIKVMCPVEDRILALIGKTAVDGIEGVAEAGFGAPPKQSQSGKSQKPVLQKSANQLKKKSVSQESADEPKTKKKKRVPVESDSEESFDYEDVAIVNVENEEPPQEIEEESEVETPPPAKEARKQLKNTRVLAPPLKSANSTLVNVLQDFSILEKEKAVKEDQKIQTEADRLQLEQEKLQLQIQKIDLLKQLVRAEERKATALEQLVTVVELHFGVRSVELFS